jgi:multidrug resistance protein, MATE family
VTDGLQKAVIAMASNLIGSEQTARLKDVLISGLKLHGLLLCVLAIPMLIYPQPIINLFLNDTVPALEITIFAMYLRWTIAFVWLYFAFDGMVWVIAGMLTAIKDTVFIMLTNATTAWLFAIVPLYFVVVKYHASPVSVWLLANVYAVINVSIFAWRYRLKYSTRGVY